MSGRDLAPEYLRVGEAARLLGVGRTSFWRLRRDEPDFPKPREFAGAARFKREDLIRWADAQDAPAG